jgi:hypothetical protein
MARTVNARIPLLISLIVTLTLAIGSVPSAVAAGTDAPPPKPAMPKGPGPTFSFNQYGPSPTDDVVLKWDEQTLAAVRATKLAPTVVARDLAVVHTAIYDAWAAYDAKAVGTRLGGSLRRPKAERTPNRKSKAISYAAYRVLLDLFPSKPVDFARFMTALGYNPADASTDTTTPQGTGNVTATAVLDYRHHDGANQLADEPGGDPSKPYSDYTGYTPVNTWDQVSDLYHWQPLCVPTPPPDATTCAGTVQTFATPQWGLVIPSRSPAPTSSGRPPWTAPSWRPRLSSWSTPRPT